MKNDGLLGRCFLKGAEGDAMNILLVAAGHNLRKTLNWLRSLFARFLREPLSQALRIWLNAGAPARAQLIPAA